MDYRKQANYNYFQSEYPEAFEQGYSDFHTGDRVNPYPFQTTLAKAWEAGYDCAQDEYNAEWGDYQ